MNPSKSVPRGRAVVATVAAAIGLAAYLVAMHALIVGGAHPAWILALILAPWLVSSVTTLARGRLKNGAAMAVFVAVLAGSGWLARNDLGRHVETLLYVENLVFVLSLSALFGLGLRAGREPLVTRLARLVRGDDMPPAVLRYTRAVTRAWSIFFAAEAVVSTVLFVTASSETWSTFVNLLQWPLAVVAFAVEYAVRVRTLRGIRHSSPMTGFKTFARRSEAGEAGRTVRDAA